MPKGVPNKRYTPEFKKLVIETMQEEKLSYSETCRRFEVNSRDRIKSWERIYLEEGPEGFAVERRPRQHRSAKEAAKGCRRRSAGRSAATACGERLPKKLASLGFGRRATPAQKTLVVQKLRQKHALKPQDQGKTEGLAACNSQTASPFGCLNNFYFKILSNFWGSLHHACPVSWISSAVCGLGILTVIPLTSTFSSAGMRIYLRPSMTRASTM